MKTLYLECNTGISGDMIVAALLDLGADRTVLEKALSGIKDSGFSTEIKRVSKNGIDCCDFNVILDAAHENHDHDMNYLYGHEEGLEHHHEHDHEHHHDHDHEDHDHDHHHEHDHEDHDHEHHHDHDEHHHDHHHEHRNLKDVIAIIDSLELTDGARKLAVRVFEILAEAEAKAHNRSLEEVHFHEVGALDSIVDIVAAAVCFDNLGITDVIIPKINEGSGTIRCQHGILPVPVPAVMNIATAHSLPLAVTQRKGELVTPTGAAFAAAVMTTSKLPEVIVPVGVGLGAGKREYEIPSILRAILLQENGSETNDCIWKLESNIDDCTGEELGFTMDCLMKAGARDVFYTPVYMKKNRPAYLLSVIAEEKDITALEDIIFRETTTIGIRKAKMERRIMPRKNVDVETKYGTVSVKLCEHNGETKVYPEYESVAELARKTGAAFREIYQTAVEEYVKK